MGVVLLLRFRNSSNVKLVKGETISEADLVKGCMSGERAMQRHLYDRFAASMKGVCLRYAKTSFEAEDLLHDAFLKVFTHLDSYKGDGSLEGWIKRIVVNTALSNHRGRMHRLELLDAAVLEGLAEPEISLPEATADDLLELVQRLPERYRVVFNLHAIEGYSHKEIGEMLDQQEATSRSQYLRARNLLKQMIDQEYKIYHERLRS